MSVINTNQLKSALERLCLVVPKRATLPVLENLRWRAAKGHLELTATDLDNHLHISIPFVGGVIDSDVDALVPAKELCQLVKTESAPSLKIRIRNGKCEVSANNRTVVLSCADPSSFPETPDGELKPQGQILGSAFDAALRRALFCVSIESGRYSTDALRLELRGSVFRVVGTDGHRLSVVEGTARTEGSSPFSALPLHSTATILSRLGLADEPRWVQFSTYGSEQEFNLFVLPDGSRLITRRGQGQFPNYENVLPKAPPEARVVFRREELLEGLAKLSPTARKAEVPAVKLELSQSPVSIKTEKDGTANSVTLDHARVSGKARDIGFNLHYLTQYVKSLETETVSMKLFSKAIYEVALFDAFPLPASPDAIASLTAADELYPQTPLPRKTQPTEVRRHSHADPQRLDCGRASLATSEIGHSSHQSTKRRKPHVSSSTSRRSTIGVPGADPASVKGR